MELAKNQSAHVNKRINWMDWAKAIGMFLVVLGHVYRGNDELKIAIYSFHMPLFFFISGFLHTKADSFISTIEKNFRSIIIPFLWFNLFWIVYIILPDILIHKKNLVDAVLDPIKLFLSGFYTTLFAFGYSWFLLALFFSKLIFDLLLKINRPVYIGIIILVSTILLYIYSTYSNSQVFNLGSAILALPYLAIGYLFKKKRLFDKIIDKAFLLIAISIILFVSTFYFSQYNGKIRMDQILYGKNFLLFYIIGLSGTLATLTFSLLLNKFYFSLIHKISAGNLVIMGTHGMLLYFYWIIFREGGYIPVSLTEKIFISVVVMLLEIPIILFIERKMPFVLGKRLK